jgi:hypothetical protein
MKNHRRLPTAEFLEELGNLIEKADGDEASFGLTPDLITQAKAIKGTLTTDETDKVGKRAASKAATTKAKSSRKTADDLVSLMKLTSKSNQTPDDKMNEIGFDADDAIASTIGVFTPSDVSVKGFSNGTNEVKLNPNGNKDGTLFNYEAKIGDAANFALIMTSTKRVFRHTGQTPGVKTLYRARAQRGDDFSEYSNVATVYE